MHEYRELKIRIERAGDGGFRTFAVGPSGEASGSFVLPFSELELENVLLRLSGQVGRRTRRVETPELSLVTSFGGKLFDALVQGRVRDLYHDSLAGARAQDKGLRITLALTDVPELMQLPWEFLYDDPNFLSLGVRTPVVRYLELPWSHEPLRVEPPLKILAMVSSPTDAVELDVGRERANLEEALGALVAAGGVEITWIENATLAELQRCLRRGHFHIFHFIGHGAYDPQLEDGVLLLEDAEGRGEAVSGVRLGTILADSHPPQLAVLNSCEGARTGRDDPFAGVASSLVQRQIPAVIAMQFEITDRAAITFARWLYESLADGYPVDSALAEARKAIYADRNDLEWGTPVLLMRVRDGRIFEIPPELRTRTNGQRPHPPPPVVPPDPPAPGRWRLAVGALAVLATLAAGLIAWLVSGSDDAWSRAAVDPAVLKGPGSQEILGITALPGDRALAVGQSGVYPAVWRFDGSDWSRQELRSQRGIMNAVATSGSRAVAVGASGGGSESDARIWRRSKSGAWEHVCSDCSGRGAQVVYAVIPRGDGFVAVGNDVDSDGYGAAVWLSTDGESWERVARADPALGGTASQVMKGIVEIEGTLVAVGRDGKDGAIWRSETGDSWEKRVIPSPQFLEITAVTRIGSRLVAVGWEGEGKNAAAAWISYDRGETWKRGRGSDFRTRGQKLLGVRPDPPGVIAVGYDHRSETPSAAVWRSSDGKTWTPVRSSSFTADGRAEMNGLAVLPGGQIFAVGGTGRPAADAAIWQKKTG